LKYKVIIPGDIAAKIRLLSPHLKSQVRFALDAIAENPQIGVPLRDKLKRFRKYRVSRYRIVYEINHHKVEVCIFEIGRRELVYDILLKKLPK